MPSSSSGQKSKPKRTARNATMDYLARRDHSEKELRKKLKDKQFPPDEIDSAMAYARERKWIPDSPAALMELAEKVANTLGRKGKGICYINNYLKEKGLPKVDADPSLELEKAISLVKNRFSDLESFDRSQKAKIGRFLISRGFDMFIVRKVVYEKF